MLVLIWMDLLAQMLFIDESPPFLSFLPHCSWFSKLLRCFLKTVSLCESLFIFQSCLLIEFIHATHYHHDIDFCVTLCKFFWFLGHCVVWMFYCTIAKFNFILGKTFLFRIQDLGTCPSSLCCPMSLHHLSHFCCSPWCWLLLLFLLGILLLVFIWCWLFWLLLFRHSCDSSNSSLVANSSSIHSSSSLSGSSIDLSLESHNLRLNLALHNFHDLLHVLILHIHLFGFRW